MNTLERLRAGQLIGSKRLKLACGLREFPPEIFTLADTLEILDLSGNALAALPDELPRLSKLRIIFCSDNQFTELPDILGQCRNLSMIGFKANRLRKVSAASLPRALRWLILTDNEIEELPGEIGHCAQLQKLMLAGNRLRTLPDTLATCSRLELLRIAANRLDELPSWLTSLPRLAWLAYAGNPFSAGQEFAALEKSPIGGIHWDELALRHQLGEGASGVIHQAEHRGKSHGPRPVAVKLFKGTVTSDGLPHCEMAASIAAGKHPNLIPVQGKVMHHPLGTNGLVMDLINPEYGNLAGPPSLESCTRDIYPPQTRFDPASALRIAHGIASAASHLHRSGIMHGDLYAHNILHGGRGEALIGDFGAASFVGADNRALAQALQQLEVRAFGCLLEELIEHCDERSGDVIATLTDLKTACQAEQVATRPLFDEIEQMLAAVMHPL